MMSYTTPKYPTQIHSTNSDLFRDFLWQPERKLGWHFWNVILMNWVVLASWRNEENSQIKSYHNPISKMSPQILRGFFWKTRKYLAKFVFYAIAMKYLSCPLFMNASLVGRKWFQLFGLQLKDYVYHNYIFKIYQLIFKLIKIHKGHNGW